MRRRRRSAAARTWSCRPSRRAPVQPRQNARTRLPAPRQPLPPRAARSSVPQRRPRRRKSASVGRCGAALPGVSTGAASDCSSGSGSGDKGRIVRIEDAGLARFGAHASQSPSRKSMARSSRMCGRPASRRQGPKVSSAAGESAESARRPGGVPDLEGCGIRGQVAGEHGGLSACRRRLGAPAARRAAARRRCRAGAASPIAPPPRASPAARRAPSP